MAKYFIAEPILIFIGIIKVLGNFQPFESFYLDYASQKYNFTLDEDKKQNLVNCRNIWCFIFTFVILFITDGLRYRPIIISGSIITLLRYILLFFWPSVFLIQVEVILSAFQHSSAIASSVYLYSKIKDESKYQKITAYVNAFFLYGMCLSTGVGLVYVNILGLNLSYLLAYNITVVFIALICAFILPSVDPEESTEGLQHVNSQNPILRTEKLHRNSALRTILHMWFNFKTAYTNIYVLKWSLWWSLTSFLALRVRYHYLTFLASIENDETYFLTKNIHPVVFIICQLTSAVLVIICSLKPTNWKARGDPILSLVSFTLSVLAIAQYFNHFWPFILIGIEVIFAIIVEVFLTICLWEIVQIIPRNSYALIVGFNTLVFNGLHNFLPFSIRMTDFVAKQEFMLYGICFAVIGIVFGLAGISRPLGNDFDQIMKRQAPDDLEK